MIMTFCMEIYCKYTIKFCREYCYNSETTKTRRDKMLRLCAIKKFNIDRNNVYIKQYVVQR